MIRKEQCNKVCRILDDVLANRPTERDTLIVAVRKAFETLEERKTGKWLVDEDGNTECPFCGNTCGFGNYCNECGADLRGEDNV